MRLYANRVIIEYSLYLNLQYISCKKRYDTLHCFTLTLNHRNFNCLSLLGLYIATWFLDRGLQYISKFVQTLLWISWLTATIANVILHSGSIRLDPEAWCPWPIEKPQKKVQCSWVGWLCWSACWKIFSSQLVWKHPIQRGNGRCI